MTRPAVILIALLALAAAASAVMPGLLAFVATQESGPTPVTTITVSGTGGAYDANGQYSSRGGEYRGYPIRVRDGDDGWHHWSTGTGWAISLASQEPGDYSGAYYAYAGPEIAGDYTGYGDAEGQTATVTQP